jgi:hypothetical protein
MPGKLPMHLSPRCGARTRRGNPCQQAAMVNSRCRMHGGPRRLPWREVAALIRAMQALASATEEASAKPHDYALPR